MESSLVNGELSNVACFSACFSFPWMSSNGCSGVFELRSTPMVDEESPFGLTVCSRQPLASKNVVSPNPLPPGGKTVIAFPNNLISINRILNILYTLLNTFINKWPSV